MHSRLPKHLNDNPKSFIHFIVDEVEDVKVVRKGVERMRRYHKFMHLNKNNIKYTAGISYCEDDATTNIWMKTVKHDQEDTNWGMMRTKLDEDYRSHMRIITGRIKLVRVKDEILNQGLVPLLNTGEPMSSYIAQDVFKMSNRFQGEDFDMEITGKEGEKYIVASSSFCRTYPNFW